MLHSRPPADPAIVSVHVFGAGPVGLAVAALLRPSDRFSVHLYEKRGDYSRTRMVQLAPYLVADSVASYCNDYIDEESVQAIFDRSELAGGLEFRRAVAPDPMALLKGWSRGFCPLNVIECSPSELIDSRTSRDRRCRRAGRRGDGGAGRAGDRLHRHEVPAPGRARPDDGEGDGQPNTYRVRLEYALVVTFLYGRPYDCNEYCKYYKSIDNGYYKFIPAVDRTCHDGHLTHVMGIVNTPAKEYERPPGYQSAAARRQPATARLPGRRWRHGVAVLPVDLAGVRVRHVPRDCLPGRTGRWRTCWPATSGSIYQQRLRVYMRTKMIKHNKDLFECVGDTFALLEKLHIS